MRIPCGACGSAERPVGLAWNVVATDGYAAHRSGATPPPPQLGVQLASSSFKMLSMY